MRTRAMQILHDARDGYRVLADATVVPLLSDADRRDLLPILRAYAVQQSVFTRSHWWRGYDALRLGTAIICVAAPVIALVGWVGAPDTLWAAVLAYLVFGGVAALGHGVRQAQQIRPAIFAVGAGAAALATAVLAGVTAQARYVWLWRGIGLGLVAALGLLVLAEGRLYGLLAVRAAVFRPLARRRAGWPLPAQLAAVRLVRLVDGLHRARVSCRHPRRRGTFLRWMNQLIKHLEWELPEATTDLRLGAAVTADTGTRTHQIIGRLRQLQIRLLHDNQLQPRAWQVSRSGSGSPLCSASFPSKRPTERTSCQPSPTQPSTIPNAIPAPRQTDHRNVRHRRGAAATGIVRQKPHQLRRT